MWSSQPLCDPVQAHTSLPATARHPYSPCRPQLMPLALESAQISRLFSFFLTLTLCPGDLVFVSEQGPDGWYIGTNITTGVAGTFPGNFVVQLDTAPEVSGLAFQRPSGLPVGRHLVFRFCSCTSRPLQGDEALARRLQMEEEARARNHSRATSSSASSMVRPVSAL